MADRELGMAEILARLEGFRREAGALPGASIPLDEGAPGPAEEPGQGGRPPLPRVALHPPVPPFDSSACVLSDVLAFRDEAFVVAAYRAALGRDPDPEGLAAHLATLRAGTRSRLEVLGALRYSPEGRALGRAVLGLWSRYRLAQLARIPLLGTAAQVLVHLLKLQAAQRHAEAVRDQTAVALNALASHQNALAEALEGALGQGEARDAERTRLLREALAAQAHLTGQMASLGSDTAAAFREAGARSAEERLSLARDLEAALAKMTSRAGEQERLLDAVRVAQEQLADRLSALSEDSKGILRALESRAEDQSHLLAETAAGQADLLSRHEELAERIASSLSWYRREYTEALADLESQVSEIRPIPLPPQLYAALQEQFRGEAGQVRERLRPYLPHLRLAGAGAPGRPVLDLGCGRGEWLSLLREEGLEAFGVDQSEVAVEICQGAGLRASAGEALAFLRTTPPGSLGGVTAFHLIEHLGTGHLLALLSTARQALAPGGLILLETPNPANLRVGACYFYLDPTHQKPLPAELVLFFLRESGFVRAELLELNPFPKSEWPRGAGAMAPMLYGPRDYGVLARVPEESAGRDRKR